MTRRYGGPLAALRAWNFKRVERRRWQREFHEATAADDAAIMDGLARLLAEVPAARAERAEAARHLAADLAALLSSERAELSALISAGLAELRATGSSGTATGDTWPVIATARTALVEPELDLIAHLAPDLDPKLAIDVGAHHGRFSEALLALGFQVHALEPNPASRDELVRRLAGRPGLTVHPIAAGPTDGEAELGLVANPDGSYTDPTQFASITGLPLPPGLVRAGAIQVPVRRLDSLVGEHRLGRPSLVKVDAEGFDLEVLRGLGELRPSVIIAEFWDDALPFSAAGAKNRLPDLVAYARGHGAPWHLVVFRRWGDDRPAFYSGYSDSPEQSWGNVLLFGDRQVYEKARSFLAGSLPEARFVSARAGG